MEATSARSPEPRFTPRSTRRPAKIRFVGALDAYTVPGEIPRLDAILASDPIDVIVDLKDCTHLDSIGVMALVTLHKRVTAQGGHIAIVDANAQPLLVLELVRKTAGFAL
jgi:anti-anti-sigma factor